MTTYTKNSAKHNNHGDLLTISEVAKRLRVEDTTVRRWINAGVLEAVELPHVGKRRGLRVKKATMDALLGEQGA